MNNSFIYKSFVYIYSYTILCAFGFGQITIPGFPFNIGQIGYVILMIYCFIIDRKLLFDKYLILYAVFMFFFFISSVLTYYEQIFYDFFIRKLFTLIPLYWGTKILISHIKSIKPLILPLLFIGILDSFVTITQVYNLGIFDGFVSFLQVADENLMEQIEMKNRRDIVMGLSMNGIYSSAVHNGHNLLFIFCASFTLLKNKINIIRILPSLIVFVGIFYCQQRSAFLLSIAAIIIFTYFFIKKKLLKLYQVGFFIILLVIVSIINSTTLSDLFAETRLSNISLNNRIVISNDAINYFLDNPLTGGMYKFTRLYGLPPHNLLINAFMAGGLFGGMVLVYMVVIQFSRIIRSVTKNYSYYLMVFATTFTMLIGDSMFHNTGYVEGDNATFITWAIIMFSNKLNKQ